MIQLSITKYKYDVMTEILYGVKLNDLRLKHNFVCISADFVLKSENRFNNFILIRFMYTRVFMH